ncbi:ArsR/SmtB family transcription factor [Candidatus Enterococcus ferrettii]|uniref:HTH arsR-type domain-containing protein n=1 Tax=Candidatus Enterococcus ferrettii TaxID=2815324 RepID=A0ABV0EUK6_9ENTE|nr:ArsR family transcriptional regulator [Enterococcus sp. 665A]MBO1339370.1 ArsR family transcriptional regulator [Enterococcus sp. 665A]
MQLDISNDSLPVYEALASAVRLKIIQLLSVNKMSVKELAAELGLSSAIVTMHVKKLETAGLISTDRLGRSKVSSLKIDSITVNFPKKIYTTYNTSNTSIPIGQYTNFSIVAPCGLATSEDFIGINDHPKYFMDPKRMNAQILWFTQGFIEYQIPNLLEEDQHLEMLEISMEIASEFPFSNNNWPSDITFSLNNKYLGTWTSPGDFSDIRGKNNPDWYPDNLNQYGLLKTIRILEHGTYMEGEPMSDTKISDFASPDNQLWTLRIEVKEDAKHVGGCTIYGKHFGNHDQNINFSLFYS